MRFQSTGTIFGDAIQIANSMIALSAKRRNGEAAPGLFLVLWQENAFNPRNHLYLMDIESDALVTLRHFASDMIMYLEAHPEALKINWSEREAEAKAAISWLIRTDRPKLSKWE